MFSRRKGRWVTQVHITLLDLTGETSGMSRKSQIMRGSAFSIGLSLPTIQGCLMGVCNIIIGIRAACCRMAHVIINATAEMLLVRLRIVVVFISI